MTKIKICGIRREEDIDIVNDLRPEYVGFVFAPSRRRISLKEAANLSRRLHPDICPVGVYVNAGTEDVVRAAELGVIRMVQLHGQESAAQIRELKALLPAGVPVMKAVSMETGQELKRWQDSEADYLLLDAGSAGGGQLFDHRLLERAEEIRKPWFLAGGMNPDNAPEAIRRFTPYGIDVSSGVETDGYKDRKKVEMMIRRVRYE